MSKRLPPTLRPDLSDWGASCNLCGGRPPMVYILRGGSEYSLLQLTVCLPCLDSIAAQTAALPKETANG